MDEDQTNDISNSLESDEHLEGVGEGPTRDEPMALDSSEDEIIDEGDDDLVNINSTDVPLKALLLVCTLKPSPSESSSDKMANDIVKELMQHDVTSEIVRAVDYDIKPGVEADMGDGDQWPELRQKMLDANIFIMVTPTWVGHMSSVAQRIIERLDAEVSSTDHDGKLHTYDKVAAVAVVGNEDGAHKITADIFQALNDVGFTVAAQAATYWNGEAMQTTDYKDLEKVPEAVASTTKTMAVNTAYLARLLKTRQYPSLES